LFKPHDISEQRREVAFYRSFLGTCDLIFDIGANDGHKTAAFLKLAGKVVCCEPDQLNRKILRVRFRHRKREVFVEDKALSDTIGHSEFHIHHPGSAFNTLSLKWKKLLEADNKKKWNEKVSFTGIVQTETTTLDSLIDKYGVPGFIKIDVEGAEPLVLRGLTRRVSCLSFETLLPDCISEMHECLSAIDHLDHFATYNIAREEELLLPYFISKTELQDWANNYLQDTCTLEIIVKMHI
jgi:FkbM family methyltransferase